MFQNSSFSLFAPKKRLFALVIFSFCLSININAQNLLSANNPGFEGLGGFQTNGYTDVSPGTGGSSSDGNYALTGNSEPMNTSSFLNVTPHSGSRMMVIDANNQIFWKQNPNVQLQGGVTYTFSYWVVNINKNGTSNPSFPNPVIKFEALDNCGCTPVLKSGNATVNSVAWQQVIYEITPTGTGGKWVRIELSTPSATPNGNDFAIDDLSLIAPPLPLAISTSYTAISCPGSTDASISAYGFGGVSPYTYKLSPTTGVATTNVTGIFTNLPADSYIVEVKDSNSPIGTKTTTVVINSVLDMTLAASTIANPVLVPATSNQPLTTTICSGTAITLNANNMSGYSWTSTPVDPSLTLSNASSITVTPTINTTYKVTANAPSGLLANLVYNGDFENDTAGFSSSYGYYATNPTFIQQAYGVISNPKTWGSVYDVAVDHTTGSGKMFITDGSTIIGDKVWGQNIAVKPGVTYDFNYFLRTITSTDPSHPAKIQLKINGVVINNTAASAIDVAPTTTAGGWLSFNHTWTAGSGVTIATVELYDTEISGSGNDFGLDDITFIPQGTSLCTPTKEISITISPGTSDTSFSFSTPVCQTATTFSPIKTTPATFTSGGVWSKSSGSGTLSINSSTGEINPSLSTDGVYTIKYEVLANTSICQAAGFSTFQITINGQPNAGTDGSTTVCDNSTAIINLFSLISGEQVGGTWSRVTGLGGTFDAISGTFTPAIGFSTSSFTYTLVGASPCLNTTSTAMVISSISPLLTIDCGTPTATSVTFTWNTIADATSYGYSYSIASGIPVNGVLTGSASSYTVTGLTPGQNVAITITPIGSICGLAASGNCVSSNCPLPTVNSIANIPVCPNGMVIVPSFVSTPSGATFNWTSNNTSIGIAASGSGNIGSFVAVNTTTSIQTATISVTANNGICTGPATTFDIVVSPAIPLPIVNTPSDYCQNGSTVPLVATALPGGTLNWYGTNATGGMASITAPTPLTTNVGSVIYYVSQSIGGCESSRVPIVVTVVADSGKRLNLFIDYGLSTATTLYFDFANVGQTSFNYSYTIDGGAPVTGIWSSPSHYIVNVASRNQCVTFTLSANGAPCVPSESASNVTTPNFTVLPAFCSGSTSPILASTSPNGIVGTWSPATVNNTIAGSYLFTPNTSFPCANNQTLTTIITPNVTPTFSPVPTICSGDLLASLPTTSLNGVVGTWLPALNNTATTLYTFTPTPGLCATSTTLTIAVNNKVIPAFTAVTPICSGTTLSALPTNSNNGIIGTWSPALNNTATTLYTFTPTIGQCATNATMTIVVNSLPTVTISGSIGVCLNSGTTILFTGTPNAIVTFTINSGAAQTLSLDATGKASLPTGNLVVDTVYNLVSVLNPNTLCSQIILGSAVVTINPTPIMTATPVLQKICSGDQTGIVLSSSITNTSYDWVVLSQTGATGASAGTGITISQTLTATGSVLGTVIYSITPKANGCFGNPINVTIEITPAPIANATPNAVSICSGDVTSFVLSTNLIGTTYEWNVVQTNVSGASAGSGIAIAQTLTTITNNIGQVVYTIKPVLNGCYGQPISVTIDVIPMPIAVANPIAETICSGEKSAITLTSSNVVGTIFNWTVIQTGVSGATAGSGTAINQKLIATGSVVGTVEYTIFPVKNTCFGLPIKVIVTVQPTPEVFGPTLTTICSNETPNISLSPNPLMVATTFDWTVVQTGVSGGTNGTGNTIDQLLEATGTTQGLVVYTVTPSLNGCKGTPIDIKVLVNPLPNPTLTDGIICVDQATNIAFETHTLSTGLSNATYSFEWFLNPSIVPIPGAVSNSYEVLIAGDYSVIATNKNTGCVSQSVTASVVASFPATAISTTQTPAFAENATITITVTGGNTVYEYQLDDGAFQSSNVFTNVSSGSHIIKVGDVNGCTNLSQNVFIIGYPKFFTPNGDGYNDSWNLNGLSDQPLAKIYIFDRYGKLIKQISSVGEGWDGTYTGQILPATDYWFTVEYSELATTKIFKSHFSLLR
jgi:gliding motility-associated-like protein